MPLREELRSTGEWLFRWRSYLPLVPLGLVVFVMLTSFAYPVGDAAADRAWELFCFGISLVGLAMRVVTVGFVPRGTSGRNTCGQRAEELNTTGIYSVVRHPLYVGNFLMWLGAALYPRVWWLALIIVLIFWLYYERIMIAEEEFLREKFGRDYIRWAEKTPAFIPRLSKWVPPNLAFCYRSVLRREFSGFFGIIATFTVLELAGDYALSGAWMLDPLWTNLFAFGLLVYAGLVLLKKRGRLDVQGR